MNCRPAAKSCCRRRCCCCCVGGWLPQTSQCGGGPLIRHGGAAPGRTAACTHGGRSRVVGAGRNQATPSCSAHSTPVTHGAQQQTPECMTVQLAVMLGGWGAQGDSRAVVPRDCAHGGGQRHKGSGWPATTPTSAVSIQQQHKAAKGTGPEDPPLPGHCHPMDHPCPHTPTPSSPSPHLPDSRTSPLGLLRRSMPRSHHRR
jgi:hypothetical protein